MKSCLAPRERRRASRTAFPRRAWEREGIPRAKRARLYLTCTAIVLLALLGACSAPEISERSAPPPAETGEGHDNEKHEEAVVELSAEAAARAGIRTAPATERVLAGELATTGQVDFDETRLAHVSPRISGRVHRVHARLGQDVGAGATLAAIDSIELGRIKAEFLQARAREELARKSYERESQLFSERISSEQEVLAAEAALREATATLLTAEETLHLYGLDQKQVEALRYDDPKASVYLLQAPFKGTIVERHATLGEMVTPERNLFTLANLDHVWIWVDIYQRDLGRVHLGDEVRARVDAFPGEVFSGTVSYLSAQVDTATRTVRARLDVPNPERKLRPGMFVQVELHDPHGAQGRAARGASLAVPASAVARDGDETVVFVAAGPNRFERREVRTGRSAGGYVEILAGLEGGTEVVVEGTFLLKSAAAKETLDAGHEH